MVNNQRCKFCRQCRYFDRGDRLIRQIGEDRTPHPSEGVCVRYAPRPEIMLIGSANFQDKTQLRWPPVCADDLACGGFEME